MEYTDDGDECVDGELTNIEILTKYQQQQRRKQKLIIFQESLKLGIFFFFCFVLNKHMDTF